MPVATERGILLISDDGTRYSMGSQEDLTSLGFTDPTHAPWRVVSALPDGGLLSEDNARAISTTINTNETTADSAMGTR